MKFQEIISKLNSKEDISGLITITPYIPFLVKRQIRNTVANLSTYIDEESSMLRSDSMLKDMYLALMICLETTNLEIDDLVDDEYQINVEVAIESYDNLIQSGLYELIRKEINMYELECDISDEIEERMSVHNSVASVLNRAIQTVLKKLPSEEGMKEVLAQLPNQIAGLKDLNIFGTGSGNVDEVKENRATRRSKKKE